jgi:hypothetical protein
MGRVLRTLYLDNTDDDKLRIKSFRKKISKGDLMTQAIHQYFALEDIPEIQLIMQYHEEIKTNPLIQSEWKRFCVFLKMSKSDLDNK